MGSLKCPINSGRSLAVVLLVALAGLACAPSSLAQVLGARPLPPQPARLAPEPAPRTPSTAKAWPQVQPPSGLTTLTRKDDDRGQLFLTRLKFPSLTLLVENNRIEDWRRIEPPGRYGIEWHSRWAPELVFGLAQLPTTSFPVPLPQSSWNNYLRALRLQYGARLKLLCDDSSLANPDILRPLAGGHTRVLDYTLAGEKPEQPTRRIVQVFMCAPQVVVVAGWEGPETLVSESLATYKSLLMSLELAGP